MARSRDIPDDADEKWEYTQHARAKHEILYRYLGAWLAILGLRSPKVFIYDGFAGRGRYTSGEEGSPLIAYKRALQATANGRPPEVEIRCVEANRANFERLRHEIEALGTDTVAIRAKQATFDEAANTLVDDLDALQAANPTWRPPPMLFLADPFGFRGVPLATVQRLMSIPRAEVLITFMVRDQRRFLKMENVAVPLTELFGGERWRDCLDAQDIDRCLVQTYRDVVSERGIATYPTTFQVFEDERSQTLYYLIHLTNDPTGMREMKKAMIKTSPEMTFWPVTIRPPDQLALDVDEQAPFQSLQRHLLEEYQGQQMTFEALLNVDYPKGLFLEPDYRVAVKDLARRDAGVAIKRDRPPTPTGRPPTGLKPEDIVKFLPRL